MFGWQTTQVASLVEPVNVSCNGQENPVYPLKLTRHNFVDSLLLIHIVCHTATIASHNSGVKIVPGTQSL